MKTIIVANNKGGVGKTTVASQIAHSLAADGKSVVCIDLDGQRNLSGSMEKAKILGSSLSLVEGGDPIQIELGAGEIGLVEGDSDLTAYHADEVMSNVSAGLRALDGADFCIVDTPPSFSVIVYGALLGGDFLLVPIELKRYSLDGLEGVLEAFFKVQEVNAGLTLLGVLPSRYDAVKASERAKLDEVNENFQSVVVPHSIHNRVAYEDAQAHGLAIAELKTKGGKEAAKEFAAFFGWLKEKIY